MTGMLARPTASALLLALLGVGSPLLACGGEDSAVEKLSDDARDALDMREHEKLKDAAEDLGDAVEGAGNAVKEEAEALKRKLE